MLNFLKKIGDPVKFAEVPVGLCFLLLLFFFFFISLLLLLLLQKAVTFTCFNSFAWIAVFILCKLPTVFLKKNKNKKSIHPSIWTMFVSASKQKRVACPSCTVIQEVLHNKLAIVIE